MFHAKAPRKADAFLKNKMNSTLAFSLIIRIQSSTLTVFGIGALLPVAKACSIGSGKNIGDSVYTESPHKRI